MPPAIVGEGERGPREEERWSGAVVDEGEEPREEERRGVALVGERERERGRRGGKSAVERVALVLGKERCTALDGSRAEGRWESGR